MPNDKTRLKDPYAFGATFESEVIGDLPARKVLSLISTAAYMPWTTMVYAAAKHIVESGFGPPIFYCEEFAGHRHFEHIEDDRHIVFDCNDGMWGSVA
jgi:hypothetical protein